MFDARQVANEILKKAWAEDLEITQLHLNKLVYFLHGHHLRDHGVPLVKDEFQAWQYGPVHRSLWQAFNGYREQPITEFATRLNPVTRKTSNLAPIRDNLALNTIHKYLDLYLEFSAGQLVDITHTAGTPWSKTMQNAVDQINIGMKISNSLIAGNFEGLAVS